jgi:hypothetical protein
MDLTWTTRNRGDSGTKGKAARRRMEGIAEATSSACQLYTVFNVLCVCVCDV